jgi:hypothetical protein
MTPMTPMMKNSDHAAPKRANAGRPDESGHATRPLRTRGRPRFGPARRVRVNITIDPADAEYARTIADGNLSAGLTRLVCEHRERVIRSD